MPHLATGNKVFIIEFSRQFSYPVFTLLSIKAEKKFASVFSGQQLSTEGFITDLVFDLELR